MKKMTLALGMVLFASTAFGMLAPPLLDAPNANQNVVKIPFSPPTTAPIAVRSWNGSLPSGVKFAAHTAMSPDPRSFGMAVQTCDDLFTTSSTADKYGCTYATNAGFFSWTSSDKCIGRLVINGSEVNGPSINAATFAATSDSLYVGFLNDTSSAYKYQSLIQGRGWLVKEGRSFVNESQDLDPKSGFVTEHAPRTAIGVMRNGSILSLVVDGIETKNEGLSLFDFADVLIASEAHYAINLDGGGSSTAVYKGKVFNYPTCNDTPLECERNVTSITCIRQQL